jgi:hypothetical protein
MDRNAVAAGLKNPSLFGTRRQQICEFEALVEHCAKNPSN